MTETDAQRTDCGPAADRGERAARIERVVAGVCEAALRESGLAAIAVAAPDTPEGRLVAGWLRRRLGPDRVAADDAVASNMQGLLAHPVNRTMLLLGGRPPRADLLPLGDVYASQVEAMAGACTLSAEIRGLAERAGGVGRLDDLLAGWIDARRDAGTALRMADRAVADEIVERFEHGRFFRLRPRLVPKLGPRTLGIDLWD